MSGKVDKRAKAEENKKIIIMMMMRINSEIIVALIPL